MSLKNRQITGTVIVILILLVAILYMLPLILKGLSSESIYELLFQNDQDFRSTLTRTILFALVTTLMTTILGLSFALLLSRIPSSSFMGKQMSWFLLPVTIGNISVAFIFKVCLFNTEFFNDVVQSTSTSKMILLGTLQVWQFIFLFTYLFWINLRNLDRNKLEFAHSADLNYWENFKDIKLPALKNLAVLLLLIGFVFAFYESAKSQFIFRSSQGINTELINHWLQRMYQSHLLVNLQYAISKALDYSLIVLLAALISFFLLGLLSNSIIKQLCKSKSTTIIQRNPFLRSDKYHYQRIAIGFEILCLSAIFLPLLLVYIRNGFNFLYNFSELGLTLVLTICAAFLASAVSVTTAVVTRLAFRRTLKDFNSRSLLIFVSMFILLLIPSLAVLLSGFQWLALSGYKNIIMIYLIWITSHVLLLAPLLISFLISIHFDVKNSEIEYISAYSLSYKEIIVNSFLKRFKLEYVLLLIIACSFIWNEAIINSILSDEIPSFAARLQMMFIGRSADYISASSYLTISILLAIVGILIWNSVVKYNNVVARKR